MKFTIFICGILNNKEINTETLLLTATATDVQKKKSQYDLTEVQQEKSTDDPTLHTR